MRPKQVRTWLYLACGTALGIVAGIVEALVSSIGSADFWWTAKLHYFQLGFGGWFFGLLGGWAVAKYVQQGRDDRWQLRMMRGECVECGYDLRGNRSGRCPECGTPAYSEPQPQADRDDSPQSS